jgi:hypothetical protein
MKRALAVPLIAALAGCGWLFASYEETPFGYVQLYPSKKHSYQLRIPYKVYSRGGAHHPFDIVGGEYNISRWISLQGQRPIFEAINMMVCPEGTDSYHSPIGIRGQVTVSGTTAIVKLQEPRYHGKAEVPAWVPSTLNGEYRIEQPTVAPAELEESKLSDCRPV